MSKKPFAILIFAIIFHVVMVWKVPWPNLFGTDFFSSSYLFEIFLGFVLIFFHKKVPSLNFKFANWQFLLNSVLVAFAFSWFISKLKIVHPFIYLTAPFVQLVIIAPLLEEWIYRYSWSSLFLRSNIKPEKTIYVTGLIFALSHMPALFYLGAEYYKFFALQFIYTFILGIICGRAFIDEDSLLTSIFSHMLFNITFYIMLF